LIAGGIYDDSNAYRWCFPTSLSHRARMFDHIHHTRRVPPLVAAKRWQRDVLTAVMYGSDGRHQLPDFNPADMRPFKDCFRLWQGEKHDARDGHEVV
jgi:hypothetical protein